MTASRRPERGAGPATPARGRPPAAEVRVGWSADRRRLRVLARAAALVVGVMLVVVLNAHPADAHAILLRSDPASGVTIAESPSLIRLWFSEDISPRVSSARLVGRDGKAVRAAAVVTHRGDRRLLELAAPRLNAGTYGVLWQVLAEDDGHTTSGTVVFSVGVSAAAPDLAASASNAPQAVNVALRWARLCALAGLVGALAVIGGVLRRVTATDPVESLGSAIRSVRKRLLTLAIGSASLGVLVGLTDLVEGVRRLPGSSLGELLSGTRWGHLWLAREAALLAVVAVLVALRGRADGWPHRDGRMVAAGVGTFAVIWIEALGSHAASVQSHRALAVAADALHILAACLWLGALPALTVMLWPRATGAPLVRACRGPFTRLIVASVGVVLVTGLYSAGRQVESVDDLFTTSYGQTLLIKSGLLAVLLGLGLVNASRLHGMHPWWLSGQRATAARPLTRRLVEIEAGIGALLLIAVGVLVETAPARGQAPIQTAVDVETRSGSVADLVVTISATPNRPGLNGFTVIAASTRRPAPAVVDGVQLEFTFGSKRSVLTLQDIEPEHYFGTSRIDEAGLVRIDAVVHRGGMRLTVPVLWQISPPLQQQAGSAPSHRLGPYVNGLVLLLIASAVVAGASYCLRRRSARQHRQVVEVIRKQTEADRVLENSP